MPTPLQDLQFSIRTLRKSPGFALTAILTLALGIGAVTSVFSVVNAVLLKPLAFPEPGRLVVIHETEAELGNLPLPVNYKHYLNWKANAKTLQDVAIFRNDSASVASGQASGADHPEMVGGLAISPNFFSVLGVMPTLGRSFLPAEAVDGHDSVVILSWNAWQKYFHGSADVIGRTLRVGGTPKTVVGVLPRSFNLPHMDEMAAHAVAQREVHPYEVFTPDVPSPNVLSDSGDYDFLSIGRLKAGVSRAQAESEIDGLQKAFFLSAHLPLHAGAVVEPLNQELTGRVSTALWLLLASVGAVLLIACVNLANLQLARAVSREREMAVRAALGAGRDRLAWSSLMDSLVLAMAGGILGIVLSFSGVRFMVAAAPASLPRLSDAHVSWAVLLAASGLSMFTALLFGILPALRAMRVHPQLALQSSPNRVANSREGQRTRHLLVAGEVAFTVVLLILTGLLTRSFAHLLNQQRDFDADHVSLAEVHLFDPQYGESDDKAAAVRIAFIDRALADLSQLPGVKSAAVTSEMPLRGETWVDILKRPDHPLPSQQEPGANMRWVSPSYATTLKIPLLRGRDLSADDKNHPTNVLISEQTARSAWPGEDPVGKTFQSSGGTYTVVGVVADARINNLKATANMVYLPYWDNPRWSLYFLVQSSQPASAIGDSVRRALWGIDPNVPIPAIKSLDNLVSDSVATERFQTMVLGTFGTTALLLALLGVYGVLAYSVSLRQQEFGIRIALGSGKTALIGLVVRQAGTPVGGGILVGLVMAAVAIRSVTSLLYDTGALDPLVIGASIGLLVVAALIAAWLPAQRAAGVDPMQALRND